MYVCANASGRRSLNRLADLAKKPMFNLPSTAPGDAGIVRYVDLMAQQ